MRSHSRTDTQTTGPPGLFAHHPPHGCIDSSLITHTGGAMGHFPGGAHINNDT